MASEDDLKEFPFMTNAEVYNLLREHVDRRDAKRAAWLARTKIRKPKKAKVTVEDQVLGYLQKAAEGGLPTEADEENTGASAQALASEFLPPDLILQLLNLRPRRSYTMDLILANHGSFSQLTEEQKESFLSQFTRSTPLDADDDGAGGEADANAAGEAEA